MKIIDISQELFSCNVYPGDTPPSFKRIKTIKDDGYNLTDIRMSVHSGTHIDAPCHFIEGAKPVSELPVDIFYGKCTVAEFSGVIGKSDIMPVLDHCHERLLLKGDCEITDEAAEAIADSRVNLIGVESQSVGNFNDPAAVHLILLGADVIPIEGLNLSGVLPGEYILSAFPLDLSGTDGAPVRAVLIKE